MSDPRRFAMSLVMVVAMLLVSAGIARAEGDALPSPLVPGRYTHVITSGGYDRQATIVVPRGFKQGDTLPVVVVLHGAGGNGGTMLDKCGWADKADAEGFIAIAPDGLGALPRQPTKFLTNPGLWNSGQLRPRSPRARIDDVAFIRALLDDLQGKLNYDASRVFCTGHSNGGGMTFRLAADLSDRFAAVGTVAGQMALAAPKPAKPLPMLYILGTEDPLLPLQGGEVKSPWGTRTAGRVADFLATWAKAIGCDTEPKVISESDNVQRLEYPSSDVGPTLTVMYLQGHGHHWPGGRTVLPESMIGPMTSKLNATDTLWQFFKDTARK